MIIPPKIGLFDSRKKPRLDLLIHKLKDKIKREEEILLKNTTNKNKMIKIIKNKILQNLKLPKLNFIFRPLRTASVFILVLIIIFGQLISPQIANAATYDFIQSGWTGGVTSNVANHGNNKTGWNQFVSKNGVDTSATVSLTPSSLSLTKTNNTDFSTGTNSQTEVSGAGDSAFVKIDEVNFTTPMVAQGKYSNGTAYSLKSDGTVWAWGNNSDGQIGDGTTIAKNTPVQVKNSTGTGYLTGVLYIAAGDATAYALTSDGKVWSWGYGGEGRLGNGGTASSSLPTQVITSGSVPLNNVSALASSFGDGVAGNAYALKKDGTVWSWGANASGQLGTGDINQSSIAVQVSGLSNVSNISAGYTFAYALTSDGKVWSWGKNNVGQLGNGTTVDSYTPTQVHGVGNVDNLEGIISISSGGATAYALKSNGTVVSWGENGAGQIGDGTRWIQKYTPVLVSGLSGVTSISGGNEFASALKSDGTVVSWGANASGQLGDNTTAVSTSPTQVHGIEDSGSLGNIVSISSGYLSASALSSDGTIVSWGNNNVGQLGNNTTINSSVPVKVLSAGIGDFNTGQKTTPKIVGGLSSTYSLKADGTVWSWGNNNYDKLGDGTGTSRSTPVQVRDSTGASFLTGIISLAAGDDFVVALKSDGTVWSWGRYGLLGNNTSEGSNIPVQVKGFNGVENLEDIVSISAASRSAYALKSDRTIWAWGINSDGQLGDNTKIDRLTPVQVLNMTNVVGISGGENSAYALKSDGTVWAWGNNFLGILGDGTQNNSNIPVQVLGPSGVIVSISSGRDFVIALKSDGTVWSWGRNEYGKLGDGTSENRNTPVQVRGLNGSGYLTGIVKISAGHHSGYALSTDGTVWSWGRNDSGQLGNNATTHKNTPIRALGFGGSGYLGNIVEISGGGNSAYALSADGTILAWGSNGNSELGNNATTQSNTPIRVHGFGNSGYFNVVNSKLAENSENSSQILKSDGTVWASGYNGWGRLGDGSSNNKDLPIQIVGSGGSGNLTGVVSIAGSLYSSHFLKSDGTVWSSGRNNWGEFGDNTTNSSDTPVQVHGTGNVSNLTDVVSISAGAGTVYALKNNGTVWAWGAGGEGQLGNNTTVDTLTPVQVLGPSGAGVLTDIVSVSGSSWSVYALKSDGTVWSWGRNAYGNLGDGTGTNRNTPVQVKIGGSEYLNNIISISGGGDGAYALKSDGTVWAWGRGDSGELGQNNDGGSSYPLQVKGAGGSNFLTEIIAIKRGISSGYALKNNGTVWAWGKGVNGELGDGTTVSKFAPVQVVGLNNIISIGTGRDSAYAIKSDGTVWDWGKNDFGQLGNRSTTSSSTPVNVKVLLPTVNFNAGTSSFYSSGNYISPVVDIGSQGALSTISYTTTLNSQTATVDMRAGDSATVDGTWTNWQTGIASTGSISGLGSHRYIQYKVNLSTVNSLVSPAFNSITINYTQYSLSGDLTSSVYDTVDSTNLLGKISWVATNTSSEDLVKFQIRSSPDGNTWSSWCGYADCTGTTYFNLADNGVSIPANHPLKNGANDRYLQYKVFLESAGGKTPVLSSVSLQYVVNAAPVFNTNYPTAGAGGVVAIQNTDSLSSDFSKINISYSARDIDTNTGTTNPNQILASFEYSINGGSSWTAIPSGDLRTEDSNLKTILGNEDTIFSAVWSAKTTVPNISVNNAKIRVTINDNEAANNTVVASSANFALDTKAPEVITPVTFDAGAANVVDSGNVVIPMPTDISAVEYRIIDDDTNSPVRDTGWQVMTGNVNLPWTFDSGIEAKVLKYQYRDLYGNTTPLTTISTLAPILASSFLVQDTSNITIPSYDLYIGWKALDDTTGFASYNLEYATSDNNSTYGDYSSAGSGMSNPTTNYYVHRNLDSSKYYRYRLGVVGTDGNTSIRAGAYTTAKPDGVQNYSEGGGGSVTTASQVENVVPTQGLDKSVTVTYKLTDASVLKKTNAIYEGRIFYNIGITLPTNAYTDGNLKVSNSSKMPASGYIQVNNEVIKYDSKDDSTNTLIGLTRGTWTTSSRATRQNVIFFAGTPVWIMASNATPTTIEKTTISTGQDGSILWNTFDEQKLAGSVYNNVGIKVSVHDNQDAGSGPLSSQNDYSETGILDTLDLSKPTIGFTTISSSGLESVETVNFAVELNHSFPLQTTVDYTIEGTATSTTDYTLANGTVTIPAGETIANVVATIINDTISESNETIIITLSNPTNSVLGLNTIHTYTITDDDTLSTIGFEETAGTGAESVTPVSIPVLLSVPSGIETTVSYTVGGVATSGSDYTLANGTVTIPAGETTSNISLAVIDDLIREDSETVTITLSSPSGATLGLNTVYTYTISDNEILPTIEFNTEASSGLETGTSINIPLSLSTSSYQNSTVDYSISGTATSVDDFTLVSGTATILAGNATVNIPLEVINDSLKESNETIIVTLSNPTNATLGTKTIYTYTINDDDSLPTVSFDGTSGTGAESVTPVSIPVSISVVSGIETTVSYVVSGTATSTSDYSLANGTVTIPAGETTSSISLSVIDDILRESDETVTITLSSPNGATLGSNTVYTYTITDNDTDPTIEFTQATSSGLENITPINIPINLSVESAKNITVDYTITGGTATSNADFVLASGTATILAGNTTANISLAVINDALKESNETIIVTLSNPTNSILGNKTEYTYIITDDETDVNIGFVKITSAGLESTDEASFDLVLSSVSSQEVSVDYTVSGTATSAVDYTLSSGTITIPAGSTSVNITASIVNDTINESNETIIVTLSNPINTTLGTKTIHTYTILDNDTIPTVGFTTTSSSGLENVSPVNIPVSISGTSYQNTSATYTVTGGTAASGDYSLASGTITIPAGSTSANISLGITDDLLKESNETVVVTLSLPVNGTLGTNITHTYTIEDNDVSSGIEFGVASETGAESVTSVSIPITLATALGIEATVDYTISGTATSGSDYTLANGTVTIPAGQTSASISLAIINDILKEESETVVVTLSNAVGATLGSNSIYTYTITDDDIFPTLGFNTVTSQSQEDVNTVDIPVVISSPYAENVTFGYSVTGGSADGGSVDYLLASGIGTITAGETTTNVSLVVFDDDLSEETETVIITISNPTNSTLGVNSIHAYSILDNEIAVTEISGSNIKSTSARIIWTTADYTDSLIEYGEIAPGSEGSYAIAKSSLDKVLNHNVYLGNLTPSTKYYFKTTSVNLAGEITISESDFTTTPGPIISSVASGNSSDTGINITWNTDIPTTSFVGYSTDSEMATPTSFGTSDLVTAHSVTLTNLIPNSIYYYLVESTDGEGNVGEDANGGSYYSFNTGEDQTPPIISNISVPIITSSDAAVVWTTNEVSDGKVMYGTSSLNYEEETDVIYTPLINHLATINDLEESTRYYYVVESSDENGNTTTSEENTFETTEIERVVISSGGGGTVGVAQELYDILLAENQNYKAKLSGLDSNVPVVSNIEVSEITAFGATVSFETSEDTIAFIEYGKEKDYNLIAANKNWTKNHQIRLYGLSLGTEYNFKINAMDKSNDTGYSENEIFTTKFLSEDLLELQNIENVEQFQAEIEATIESILPSLVPPFIDKPVVSDVTESSATISFRTNIKSYPILSYTLDSNYDSSKNNPYDGEMSDTTEKRVSHTLSIIGLKPNTKYHVMVKAFSLPQVVGKSEDFTFTTAASKIQASVIDIKKDSFTVVWNTDEPTSSIVEYKNIRTGRVSRIVDDIKNNSHSVKIENLSPGTSYEINVSGINNKGNLVESSSQINIKTSTDNIPPVITNLKVDSALVVGRTDRVQTIISWQTDEPSTSMVYYQEGSGSLKEELSNKQEDFELTKNHVVILTVLKPGTVYRFTVSSTDDANNTVKPPIRTIITPKKTESIVDVIFKNFDETFNFINNVR